MNPSSVRTIDQPIMRAALGVTHTLYACARACVCVCTRERASIFYPSLYLLRTYILPFGLGLDCK